MTDNLLKPNELLYIRTMGKAKAVSGLFDSDEAASAWLARHSDHGIVAVFGDRIYTAHLYSEALLKDHRHPRARKERGARS